MEAFKKELKLKPFDYFRKHFEMINMMYGLVLNTIEIDVLSYIMCSNNIVHKGTYNKFRKVIPYTMNEFQATVFKLEKKGLLYHPDIIKYVLMSVKPIYTPDPEAQIYIIKYSNEKYDI